MAILNLFCFLTLFILLLPATTYAGTFNAQYDRLDNGMEIVVIPNHRAPVVHHMVFYKTGAADEQSGKSGIAHLFEHLMFRGTKTLKDGEFSKTVARLGGRDNAFTSQDCTSYHQSINKDHLEKMMAMEADRMINLDLSKENIEKERQVVIEERKQRLENNPFARFYERLNPLLYTNHPYSIPTIGWLHEIESYTEDDIKKFYQKWYAPNNAILVVSGDISLKEVKLMAEKTYGALSPKGYFPPRERPQIPENLTKNMSISTTFSDPQISQFYWQTHRLVPSHSMNLKTSMALDIIIEILDGNEASPLYKTLIKEQGKAISAGISYDGSKLDWGTLSFSAVFNNDTEINDFKIALETLLKTYEEKGFTQEDINNAKAKMTDRLILMRDDLTSPAYIFGKSMTSGLTFDEIENWHLHLEQVTKEDIDHVFQNYILNYNGPNSIVEAILMPETKDTKEQEEL